MPDYPSICSTQIARDLAAKNAHCGRNAGLGGGEVIYLVVANLPRKVGKMASTVYDPAGAFKEFIP